MKKSARKLAVIKSAGRKPSLRRTAPRRASAVKKAGGLAIRLLMDDHEKVKKMFTAFEALKKRNGTADRKAALVRAACAALSVHDKLETEIFYPAVRPRIRDADIMDEAEVEHEGARALIAQLSGMEPADDLYDARFMVLAEQVRHHIREEEGEMFPAARRAAVDLDAIGREMLRRKAEIEAGPGEMAFGILSPLAGHRAGGRVH